MKKGVDILFTETSKNCTMIDCEAGSMENRGQGHYFIRTKIGNFTKKNPQIMLLGLLGGIASLIKIYQFFFNL